MSTKHHKPFKHQKVGISVLMDGLAKQPIYEEDVAEFVPLHPTGEATITTEPILEEFSIAINELHETKILVDESLVAQEASYLIVQEILKDNHFLPALADLVGQSIVDKMSHVNQFGFVKKYGADNQLLKIKQALDGFIVDMVKALNNDIHQIANETFLRVKNG